MYGERVSVELAPGVEQRPYKRFGPIGRAGGRLAHRGEDRAWCGCAEHAEKGEPEPLPTLRSWSEWIRESQVYTLDEIARIRVRLGVPVRREFQTTLEQADDQD